VSVAPAGKLFKIIGAVNEVSSFPVANSEETTPWGGQQHDLVAADDLIRRKNLWLLNLVPFLTVKS
jgi:hypothetical protein